MGKYIKKGIERPLSQTTGGGRVLVGVKKVGGLWIAVIVDTDIMKGIGMNWADRITKFCCIYPYQKTKREPEIIEAAKRYAASHKGALRKLTLELQRITGGEKV